MTKDYKLWNYLPIKHELILNQDLFQQEVSFIEKTNKGIEYYKHIYDHITLHTDNLNNSHIMYACGKVSKLNKFHPTIKIKEVYSLADVDVDMPISFREYMIDYAKKTYGKSHIGYIITFNRMDGRGAVKEVFRVLEPVDNAFSIANSITRKMVDTAKVQDVLEDLKEDHPDYNIIQYNIDHIPEVAEAYKDYKDVFDIAIKISSTIRNSGKHAAGIIISNEPLADICPIIKDDSGDNIVAFEMADAEYCGLVKYDFLGVAAYEKIDKITEMINGNLLMPIIGEELQVEYSHV